MPQLTNTLPTQSNHSLLFILDLFSFQLFSGNEWMFGDGQLLKTLALDIVVHDHSGIP